jgi:hypothetical protein
MSLVIIKVRRTTIFFSHNTNSLALDIMSIASNNQQQQTQQQSQYTPSSSSSDACINSIFAFSFPEQDPIFPSFDPPPARTNIDYTRRHSVAVSGDFNSSYQPNIFNTYAPQTPPQPATVLPMHNQRMLPQRPQQQFTKQPPFLSRKTHQHLATVIEGEAPPNMGHRASMPNIFLSEESRRKLNSSIQQRNGSLSARTTPNSTPPPVSIDFNQMPWSNTAAAKPNNDLHDTNSPQFHEWNPPSNVFTSHPPASQVEERPGRKRFYSQQFDSFPTQQQRIMPFNQTSYRQLQQQSTSSNLCPLPMSGIMSRRASVATPHDISAWNRMVNPNDRILLDQEQSRKQDSEEPAAKRIKEEEEISETNSISGSVLSTEEDYPAITDADLEAAKKDPNAIPRRQKLRFDEDEYTPKWVRYTGQSKEGYCDTCKPGKWLQLKNSAYWYHKQFYHGISSVSGKPFQRPLEQRAGEHDVIEGLCHQCKQFVPICNSKRKNSVLWFRHAHKVLPSWFNLTLLLINII